MKKEVKLIALDLDRTLLFNHQFANPDDIKELQRLQNEGYMITLSTGQDYVEASGWAKQIGIDKFINKIVCQNGSFITSVDKFEPEYIYTVDEEVSRGLVNYFRENKISSGFQKYNDFWTFYYLNDDPVKLEKILPKKGMKLVEIDDNTSLKDFSFIWTRLPAGEDDAFYEHIESMFPNKLSLTSSLTDDLKSTDLMMSDINATKGNGLMKLAKEFNLSPDQILVFGDGGNDVSMFEQVKYSVAMGDSRQRVKDAATFVTDSCVNSGVANFLKKHF